MGKLFGEIAYIIDAIQDYKKDLRKNNYNPINLTDGDIDSKIDHAKRIVKTKIRELAKSCSNLPLSSSKKEYFNNRINFIYSNAFGKKVKLSLKKRIKTSKEISKKLSYNFNGIITQKTSYLFYTSILVIAVLIVPSVMHAGMVESIDANSFVNTINPDECENDTEDVDCCVACCTLLCAASCAAIFGSENDKYEDDGYYC